MARYFHDFAYSHVESRDVDGAFSNRRCFLSRWSFLLLGFLFLLLLSLVISIWRTWCLLLDRWFGYFRGRSLIWHRNLLLAVGSFESDELLLCNLNLLLEVIVLLLNLAYLAADVLILNRRELKIV